MVHVDVLYTQLHNYQLAFGRNGQACGLVSLRPPDSAGELEKHLAVSWSLGKAGGDGGDCNRPVVADSMFEFDPDIMFDPVDSLTSARLVGPTASSPEA